MTDLGVNGLKTVEMNFRSEAAPKKPGFFTNNRLSHEMRASVNERLLPEKRPEIATPGLGNRHTISRFELTGGEDGHEMRASNSRAKIY
jgi:hypothetical protein